MTRPPIYLTCSEGTKHNHQTISPVPRALYNIEPCLRHGRFQSHLDNPLPEDMTNVDRAVSNIFYFKNLHPLMASIEKLLSLLGKSELDRGNRTDTDDKA